MLSKEDSLRVRGEVVPVTINCNLRVSNRVVLVTFSSTVDGNFFTKTYKTVTDDKGFYQDFKKYLDEKLTILDIVETRLKNKGFSEVENAADPV